MVHNATTEGKKVKGTQGLYTVLKSIVLSKIKLAMIIRNKQWRSIPTASNPIHAQDESVCYNKASSNRKDNGRK